MKQYIYNYVGGLTDSWHDGGGLVIITKGDPQLALNLHFAADYPEDLDAGYLKAPTLGVPDHVYDLAGTPEEAVIIFPDTGCC